MGSHYRVYVGPYLRCITRLREEKRTTYVCGSGDCSVRKSFLALPYGCAHCPKCGQSTERVTHTVEGQLRDDIDVYAVNEMTDEMVTPWAVDGGDEGVHLLVPNRSLFNRAYAYGEDDDMASGELVDDVPAKVVSETTEFMHACSKAIEAASEVYGSANVKVCWGVLGEWA